MSNYEQRDNSGSLFKNERREKETHAHAQGKAMIDGKMYYVSAWTKDGTKGKWQSLSFKPVEEAGDRRNEGRAPSASAALDGLDEIPF